MKNFILVLLLMGFNIAWSQSESNPVKWTFAVEETDGEYTFVATANMDDNWVIYSQHTGEGGPIPLSFSYGEGITLIGKTEEKSEAITEMSELFETEVIKFKKEAKFSQRFTAEEGVEKISGILKFMTCDGERCLPPTEVAFEVVL